MIEQFEVPTKIADDIEDVLFSTKYVSWLLHQETVFKHEQSEYQYRFNFSSSKIAEYEIVEKYWFHTAALKINHSGEEEIRNDIVLAQIKPLQDHIALNVIKEPVSVMRVFFNMFLYSSIKNSIAHPHLDARTSKILSCIYYANDCTGDTVIFDENANVIKKISPKKGTGVVFDSNLLHAGCFPNDEKVPRVIVNFLFKYI